MTIACGNCGPYTESEGYRYVCTCTCKLLRVPLLDVLEPCRSANGGWHGGDGSHSLVALLLHDVHKLVLVSGPECFRSCTTS